MSQESVNPSPKPGEASYKPPPGKPSLINELFPSTGLLNAIGDPKVFEEAAKRPGQGLFGGFTGSKYFLSSTVPATSTESAVNPFMNQHTSSAAPSENQKLGMSQQNSLFGAKSGSNNELLPKNPLSPEITSTSSTNIPTAGGLNFGQNQPSKNPSSQSSPSTFPSFPKAGATKSSSTDSLFSNLKSTPQSSITPNINIANPGNNLFGNQVPTKDNSSLSPASGNISESQGEGKKMSEGSMPLWDQKTFGSNSFAQNKVGKTSGSFFDFKQATSTATLDHQSVPQTAAAAGNSSLFENQHATQKDIQNQSQQNPMSTTPASFLNPSITSSKPKIGNTGFPSFGDLSQPGKQVLKTIPESIEESYVENKRKSAEILGESPEKKAPSKGKAEDSFSTSRDLSNHQPSAQKKDGAFNSMRGLTSRTFEVPSQFNPTSLKEGTIKPNEFSFHHSITKTDSLSPNPQLTTPASFGDKTISFSDKPASFGDKPASFGDKCVLVGQPRPFEQTEKKGYEASNGLNGKGSVEDRKQADGLSYITCGMLKQRQKMGGLSSFLSHKKKDLVESIKLNFTTRRNPLGKRAPVGQESAVEKLIGDLSEASMALLGVQERAQGFIRTLMREMLRAQRYQQLLLHTPHTLNHKYIYDKAIYSKDFNGRESLNMHSPFVLELLSKFISHYYISQDSYLTTLLTQNQLLQLTSSDIFEHLFTYSLQSEHSSTQYEEQSQLKALIEDLHMTLKRKLIFVLEQCNQRIHKRVRLLKSDSVPSLLQLLDESNDPQIISLALKVLLCAVNFSSTEKKQSEYKVICESKSMALLPFRTLLSRLSKSKTLAQPSFTDLYFHIRGDQWLEWLEIYLGNDRDLKHQEASYLVESICSITPSLLITRALNKKLPIAKFMTALREQGYKDLFFRCLTACLHSAESEREIEEFYFKQRKLLLYELKDIVKKITSPDFKQDIEVQYEQAKICFVMKALQVAPLKANELELKLFEDQPVLAELQSQETNLNNYRYRRVVYLVLDTLTYFVKRDPHSSVIVEVLKALNSLLSTKQLESIALECMNINNPNFEFLSSCANQNTLDMASDLLRFILRHDEFYDLAFQGIEFNDTFLEASSERYKMAEYEIALQEIRKNLNIDRFSLMGSWFQELISVVHIQKYNPELLNLFVQKLFILPFPKPPQANIFAPTISYALSLNTVPGIFTCIAQALNTFPIWEHLSRLLQFKTVLHNTVPELVNEELSTNSDSEKARIMVGSLKLFRNLLYLNEILIEFQDSCPNHFIVKTLSRIKVLSKIAKPNVVLTSRVVVQQGQLMLAMAAQVKPGQQLINWSLTTRIDWICLTSDQQFVAKLTKYERENRSNIDYELISNPMSFSKSKRIQNCENITTISLQILVALFNANPEFSLEDALQNFLKYSMDIDKSKAVSKEILINISSVLLEYLCRAKSVYIREQILEFVYEVKSGAANPRNVQFVDSFFNEYLSFGAHEEKQFRIMKFIIKILLEEVSCNNFTHETFIEPLLMSFFSNFHLKDSYLRGDRQASSKADLAVMVRIYLDRNYEEINAHQLERIIDERALVDIGEQLSCLKNSISLLSITLYRQKNIAKCLSAFYSLIASENLLLLDCVIPAVGEFAETTETKQNKLTHQIPRMFERDTLELYLTELKSAQRKGEIQRKQKHNLLAWLFDHLRHFSRSLTTFTSICLTINRCLYSNNPIQILQQAPLRNSTLFPQLSMLRVPYDTVSMLGKNELEAVSNVQSICEVVIGRMEQFRVDSDTQQFFHRQREEGLQLVSFCLEWIKRRKRAGEEALVSIMRKLNKNLLFLAQNSVIASSREMKLLMSVLSMERRLLSDIAQTHIKQCIYNTVASAQPVRTNNDPFDYQCIRHQALALVPFLPPEKHQVPFVESIVTMWINQTNDQFFYSCSKVMMELCHSFPAEILARKPFSRCYKLSMIKEDRYEGEARSSSNITWMWSLRILLTIISQNQQVATNQEVLDFLKRHRKRIINVLSDNSLKISKAFAEELEVVLQLLCCLFCSSTWLCLEKTAFEEFTYVLLNKTVNLFADSAHRRFNYTPHSRNEKDFAQVTARESLDEEQVEIDFVQTGNMFSLELDIRMLCATRAFAFAAGKALQQSTFVDEYFDKPVHEHYKYSNLYWDKANKSLLPLLKSVEMALYRWSKSSHQDNLELLADCTHSPDTFVDNGYLSTVMQLPTSREELLQEIELLGYLAAQVNVLHLQQQKKYMRKRSSLMTSHIGAYAKRLAETLSKLHTQMEGCGVHGEYIPEDCFGTMREQVLGQLGKEQDRSMMHS